MNIIFISTLISLLGVTVDARNINCQLLNEKNCKKEFLCAAEFGPSCPNCEDISYRGCRALSSKEVKIKKDYSIKCTQSGGLFVGGVHQFGVCKCKEPLIDVQLIGCLTSESACELLGGKELQFGAPCPVDTKSNNVPYCDESNKLKWKICSCPNGNQGPSPVPGEVNDLKSANWRCKSK